MKQLKLKAITLSALLSLTVAATAAADVPSSESDAPSARMEHRLGAYLGVDDPSPGLLGINLAYNAFDWLRFTAGYASLSTSIGDDESSATTIGAGVRALVPGWSLSPSVGLAYAHIGYSGDGGLTVGGFNESGSQVYGSVGLDYQAHSGFNGAIGLNQSFRSGIGTSAYVNLGWFFNLPI